jgi:hypothetical protein
MLHFIHFTLTLAVPSREAIRAETFVSSRIKSNIRVLVRVHACRPMLTGLGITRVLRDLAVSATVSWDAKTFVAILVAQPDQVTLAVALVVTSTMIKARVESTGVRQVLS